MVFSSLTFLLIFLPLVLFLYYIAKDNYKNYVLLVVSLFFYSWGEPKYILCMLISIIVNYYFALLIDESRSKIWKSKLLLILSLVFNIGLLLYFKYTDFFISNLNYIFDLDIGLKNIILPIGISFYTFQILSYVVDVYKKDVKVQKNIFYLGAYIAFFPQLIAGPIVRYSTIEEQLNNRNHSFKLFVDGLKRFIIGMGKKVIIANNVAIIADTILNSSSSFDSGSLILLFALLSYTFQIYYDFSGYSDMAIGLGKMFGFEFLENFNYPYISSSITEFWRRWHISLSTWFRDYVYIPLGGNRVSKFKHIRNILIVWLLTGFWHGASWNFIIWGLYFAILLFLEKFIIKKFLDKIPKIVGWLYAFILINIGWAIFRIENLSSLFNFFESLFNLKYLINLEFVANNYFLVKYVPFIFLAVIGMFPLFPKLKNQFKNSIYFEVIENMFLVLVLVLSICLLINTSYNPFIYFRF